MLWCQHILFGYVTDAQKEPIIGAHIKVKDEIAISNSYGFYSMSVEGGTILISFSHAGFSSGDTTLVMAADRQLDILLDYRTLGEVVVKGEKTMLDVRKRTDIGTVSIPVKRLMTIPSLSGSQDVIRGLSILPGIHTGHEASAGLLVRGGTPDQNLLLIDNTPVYNPYHLFGLFSTFNPDAIKNIDVHKGRMPAKYGDRLSSVVSIKIKEGNLKKWSSKYAMGLISSSVVADGPLRKDTTGLFLAARLSYLSLLTAPLRLLTASGVNIDSYADYTLYDINAKLHHVIDRKKKIFLNIYAGNDHHVGLSQTGKNRTTESSNASGYNWGNMTFSVRKTKQLGNSTFMEDQLLFTRYATNLFGRQREIENNVKSEYVQKRFSVLNEATVSKQVSHWSTNDHWLTAGISFSYRRAVPIRTYFKTSYTDVVLPAPTLKVIHGYLGSIYFEDNWKINEHWILDLGMRYQIYLSAKSVYHSPEPRINLGCSLTNIISWNASYSRTSQSIHGLSGVYEALPIHGWVNASKRTPVQFADQWSTGLKYQTDAIAVTFDSYYRLFHDQIDFQEGYSLLSGYNTDIEELVETGGSGYAYGCELSLNKNIGRLKYLLSYTLSWNRRQFQSISNGKEYFHRNDQRHNLTLFNSYRLNASWDFSMLFQFSTGARQTLPTTSFVSPDGTYDIFHTSNRNNFIGPNYHRLDMSATYRWLSKEKRRRKSLTFNLTNAYFRKNVSYYELRENFIYDDNRNFIRTDYSLKEVSILPIVPSFTYTVDLSKR